MYYDFVEIGSCNFETCLDLPEFNEDSRGILVEPVPGRVPDTTGYRNVTKVQAAIGPKRGVEKIWYIPTKELSGLESWAIGCSKLAKKHPTVPRCLQLHEDVIVFTPMDLMRLYFIDSVGFLKIDCEGMDCVILNEWINAVEVSSRIMPEKIQFEANTLTDKQEIKESIDRLEGDFGYHCKWSGENVIATRHEE